MDYEPGELVERRYGHGEHRFGRIQSRVREGYDAWYVNCDVGMTFCDNGRESAACAPAREIEGPLSSEQQSLTPHWPHGKCEQR